MIEEGHGVHIAGKKNTESKIMAILFSPFKMLGTKNCREIEYTRLIKPIQTYDAIYRNIGYRKKQKDLS